jgi:hypothetical protein
VPVIDPSLKHFRLAPQRACAYNGRDALCRTGAVPLTCKVRAEAWPRKLFVVAKAET